MNKDLILIIIGMIAFVVIILLLCNMFLIKHKSVKSTPKTEEKPQEVEDDIPKVLAEVTLGNYMQEVTKLSDEQLLKENMVENKNIAKKIEVDTFKPISASSIYEMEELDKDGYYYDDEPLKVNDIVEQMDKEMEDDHFGDECMYEDEDNQTVSQEIRKLSPKMKALLIANMLSKKDDL